MPTENEIKFWRLLLDMTDEDFDTLYNGYREYGVHHLSGLLTAAKVHRAREY